MNNNEKILIDEDRRLSDRHAEYQGNLQRYVSKYADDLAHRLVMVRRLSEVLAEMNVSGENVNYNMTRQIRASLVPFERVDIVNYTLENIDKILEKQKLLGELYDMMERLDLFLEKE